VERNNEFYYSEKVIVKTSYFLIYFNVKVISTVSITGIPLAKNVICILGQLKWLPA